MKIDELPEEIPLGRSTDLRGQKFGMLTPLYRVKNKISVGGCPKTTWACKCDCGNYHVATANNLKKGEVVDCGRHSYDITGQKFGHLTAIRPTDDNDNKRSIIWYCECDCGGHAYASASMLKSGARIKCDDHEINTMIGKQFGELTVLRYDKTVNKKRYYYCRCSCGRYCSVHGTSLKNGSTQSCGHLNSIGERNIMDILDANNVQYIPQKKFDSCRFPDTNYHARFDFYIISDNPFVLEFDGIQHEKPSASKIYNEEHYKKQRKRDIFKNNWCFQNGITIKRIPYKYRDKITMDLIFSDKFIITPQTHPEMFSM